MTPHRYVIVPLELHEPERPAIWRCACGSQRQDPTPRLTDDCKAMALDGVA